MLFSASATALISAASLLIGSTAAAATPVARAACNPAIANTAISIASGSLEIGYAGSVPGVAVVSEGLTPNAPEFIAVPATVVNGGFVLQVLNLSEKSYSALVGVEPVPSRSMAQCLGLGSNAQFRILHAVPSHRASSNLCHG
ncbi:hypothetical protein C8R46DRAFT_1300839 [Mycena filopes]|nr:hypothetical protein C8R46DRAFT_1300839 [Mycena filopes]